ncbi:MAG TPA: peptidyl-alpha-hydroxyglycine alpha-amidating lyase family protein [Bryobacteraceae bacterium]|nr:peptidyl-alpha-hydroxyglycine alpha-amidating lyase family protein [Bryobacteraceae bacterium]
MRISNLVLTLAAALPCLGQLQTGPPLPYHVVRDWAQLPAGWNFGEVSAVDVDKSDNVWVFNRGPHPVIEFDASGKMLQAWPEVPVRTAHGLRLDADGNVWTVDVDAHRVMKWTPSGKLLMMIGGVGGAAGNNDSKDAFNRPANLTFAPNGDFFVADGYVNSRVVHFNKDGEYIAHWGHKGTGDSEFDIVHDVALDGQGRVYVADRTNKRVQIFDQSGKFLGKWTDAGSPFGLYYVARENAMYMCDGLNDRIVKLNLDGQVLGVLSSYGKTPGKLDVVHYMAVDSTGAIYTAEIKNWRVQKFAK